METLKELEQQVLEIQAEIEKLDANDAKVVELKTQKVEIERKMRFDGGGFNPDNARHLFVRKGEKREYGLEELALGRMILGARGLELPDEMEARFQSLADTARKYTLTTGGVGTGAELTDTLMWDQLFQDVHAATLVANLFRPFIDMAAGKYELSEMGDAVFYKPSAEGVAVTATDPTTAKRNLIAYTLKAQIDISDEESEDSIINLLSTLRATLVRNAAEVIDEMILNADATLLKVNINHYYPTTGEDIDVASRFLIGFDGLIHYCLDEVTGQADTLGAGTAGALSEDDFATLISMLEKYGDKQERLAFIVDRWVKNKMLTIESFKTVDKLGDKATLLIGQVGQVFGVPVVMSGQLAKSCATGQVHQTAASNTLGRIIAVNRDMWKVGLRRSIRVAVQRDEPKTLTSIVATMRIGLQCLGDRDSVTGAPHTALGYNVIIAAAE